MRWRLAGLWLGLPVSAPLPAATWIVGPVGKGDFTEIQPALAAAASGDTVLVLEGTYGLEQPLDFNRLRDPAYGEPAKDLILRSASGPRADDPPPRRPRRRSQEHRRDGLPQR
jgi:hypothetical protein